MYCKSLNYIKCSKNQESVRSSIVGAFDVIQLSVRTVRRVSLMRLGLGSVEEF